MIKIFIISLFFSQTLCEILKDPIQFATLVEPNVITGIAPCTNRSRTYESNLRGCSWFWICRDSQTGTLLDTPIEGLCPNDLHFNDFNQVCTYDDGFCSIDDNNFFATPTACTAWRMDLIPHVFSCNQYYLCWQNYATLMHCSEGEHFSYFQNGCVRSELADCRAEHNYCRRMRNENLKVRRNPYSCGSYHACYECNNRLSTIEFKCNDGTHLFNEEYQHCDIAENVTCSVNFPEPIPGDIFPPNPLAIQCSPSDQLQGFVAHPEDCLYYFNCASGRSRLLKCPQTTYFRRDASQCWPSQNKSCEEIYPTITTTSTTDATTSTTDGTTSTTDATTSTTDAATSTTDATTSTTDATTSTTYATTSTTDATTSTTDATTSTTDPTTTTPTQ